MACNNSKPFKKHCEDTDMEGKSRTKIQKMHRTVAKYILTEKRLLQAPNTSLFKWLYNIHTYILHLN